MDKATMNISFNNFLKDSRANWKYVFIVFALALIVSVSVVVFRYWWLPSQETEILQINFSERRGETSGWKTYRNEEYGFELNYPSDWFIADGKIRLEYDSSFGIDNFELVFARSEEGLSEAFDGDELIFLAHGWDELWIYISETSLAEIGLSVFSLAPEGGECEIVNFSGVEAVKCLWTGISYVGDRQTPHIKFDYQGRGWEISWPTFSEDTLEYDPVYGQILSSFRFLE